jgi:hypothetical protein
MPVLHAEQDQLYPIGLIDAHTCCPVSRRSAQASGSKNKCPSGLMWKLPFTGAPSGSTPQRVGAGGSIRLASSVAAL